MDSNVQRRINYTNDNLHQLNQSDWWKKRLRRMMGIICKKKIQLIIWKKRLSKNSFEPRAVRFGKLAKGASRKVNVGYAPNYFFTCNRYDEECAKRKSPACNPSRTKNIDLGFNFGLHENVTVDTISYNCFNKTQFLYRITYYISSLKVPYSYNVPKIVLIKLSRLCNKPMT